jgi:hypothetical protein
MNTFERQGIALSYREAGSMPFVFQHGLAGGAAQTL